MKFRLFCKYFLIGSLMALPKGVDNFHDTGISLHAQQTVLVDNIPSTQDKIDKKAQELCDTYIEFVLQGQKNIKNNKARYRRAVQQELPGAPMTPGHTWHCIYGQYTQLNRALKSLGDTITLIPYDGRNACPAFRTEMQKKYSGTEYAGALHSGKMFKSDNDYNRAMNAYLKYNHINDSTPDDKRNAVIARFEKNNFKASDLHPGTIIIVQHNNASSNTHAIMFLGRGRVENGEFIEDKNGKFIYAGYNNESVGDIFTTYNTNRIFAADIYNIASVSYAKELQNVKNMTNQELFQFIYDTPGNMCYIAPERKKLQELAETKYFDKQNFVPQIPTPMVYTASVPVFPVYNIIANRRKFSK